MYICLYLHGNVATAIWQWCLVCQWVLVYRFLLSTKVANKSFIQISD